MNDTLTMAPPRPTANLHVVRHIAGVGVRLAVTGAGLAFLVGVFAFGQRVGWVTPKFAGLVGETATETKDDWCGDHAVPESACVECDKSLSPAGPVPAWCKEHGLPVCPLCRPDLAQTPTAAGVSVEDRSRAAAMLAFAPRGENARRCKLHERRLQFASAEIVAALGIRFTEVKRGPVEEVVTAPGEVTYDPARHAKVSPRLPGTVVRVLKNVGDRVAAGEVVAVIDAPEVGGAKAEFHRAAAANEFKRQTLAGLRAMAGAVPEKALRAAEAELEEATVRFLAAEQVLANYGVSPSSAAGNELAVTAPFAGEIVARAAVPGERADPTRPLFTFADTGRMVLTLKVRLEEADSVRPGQPVRFRHAGQGDADTGSVMWVGPAADAATRTVPVRVELPNADRKHRANTCGTATILLRSEPNAVLVPASAVHWEGDCHVVFVRDRNYASADGFKLVHVRKVRIGARNGTNVEVVGVLPGEVIAGANSGVLRSELLKNGLGAGCGCHDH